MKRVLQVTLVWLAVFVLPSDNWAQPIDHSSGGHISTLTTPEPQLWLLDVDARLQQRFHHNLRFARLKAAGKPLASTDADIIQGSKNPELFLPWEPFRFLLSTAFYADPAVAAAWRSHFSNAVPNLEVNDAFWIELEKISSSYVHRQKEIASLSSGMQGAAPDRQGYFHKLIVAAETGQCRQRQIALERANETFGRERFAEFLYRAVAPDLYQFGGDLHVQLV